MQKAVTNILPVAPFDFDLTAGYHTYFQGRYGSDSLTDGLYRRLLDLEGNLVLASVRSVGSVETPELAVELRSQRLNPQDIKKATEQVAWLLGTSQDLAPFYQAAQKDTPLSAIVQQYHGLHLPHTASVYEAVVLAILGQQIATNVARIIRTLIIETHGPTQVFDGEDFYAFPRPETLGNLSIEELRGMKLSQRKAEYVQGISQAAKDFSTDFSPNRALPVNTSVQVANNKENAGLLIEQWTQKNVKKGWKTV